MVYVRTIDFNFSSNCKHIVEPEFFHKQLDQHIEEVCPKTKMMCEFEYIGCTHRVCLSAIASCLIIRSILISFLICLCQGRPANDVNGLRKLGTHGGTLAACHVFQCP